MEKVAIDIHKELIELSKIGDSKAQFRLYQLYSKAMYNLCYRILNTRQEAEDALQESFSEAFIKLSSFRYESTFGAWLKRLVVNHSINMLKRKKVELQLTDNIQEYEPETQEEDDSEENIALEVGKIRQAVEMLPEGYRLIFSLYAFEGYDHSEIAEILKITESTSKSQYLRSKRKLIEILKNNIESK